MVPPFGIASRAFTARLSTAKLQRRQIGLQLARVLGNPGQDADIVAQAMAQQLAQSLQMRRDLKPAADSTAGAGQRPVADG